MKGLAPIWSGPRKSEDVVRNPFPPSDVDAMADRATPCTSLMNLTAAEDAMLPGGQPRDATIEVFVSHICMPYMHFRLHGR
jgi:hypothetical protein